MNPTLDDLRSVYAERVMPDDATELERRLLASVAGIDDAVDVRAGALTRRSTWLVAAAVAMVLALAGGLLLVGRQHARPTPTGTQAPAAAVVRWTIHVTPPAGYRVTMRSVTPQRELVGFDVAGAAPATCDCQYASTTTFAVFYARGAFRPSSIAHRVAVHVGGRPGYLGTRRPDPIDSITPMAFTPLRVLAWRYAPGAWAVVYTRRPATASRLLSIARAVDVGSTIEVRTPLRLGSAARGLHVLSATQIVRPEGHGARPHLSIVLASTATYGAPGMRELSIEIWPHGGADQVDNLALMTRPISIGGRPGFAGARGSSAPQAYFRIGRAVVYLDSQGMPAAAFDRVLAAITWAPHVTADEGTWFDAATLLGR